MFVIGYVYAHGRYPSLGECYTADTMEDAIGKATDLVLRCAKANGSVIPNREDVVKELLSSADYSDDTWAVCISQSEE